MTKNSKSVAEMFALGVINYSQVLEEVPEEELFECLEYSVQYGNQYDDWCKKQQTKSEDHTEDYVGFLGIIAAAASILGIIAMTA